MKTVTQPLICFFLLSFLFVAAGEGGNNPITVSRDNEYGTEESENVMYGPDAGYEGPSNTFYGIGAGTSITTGNDNTFLGYRAGYNNTAGDHNTFVGYAAGDNNTSGGYNAFLGRGAGLSNTTAFSGTFVGYGAGQHNTTGAANTFLGRSAGFLNTTGYSNLFLGYLAGYGNTEGYNNTFLGLAAGNNNSTGNSNLFIGYYAGLNETGSHKLYIANSSTSDPLIYGEFDNDIVTINGKLGIGTKTPGYPMEIVRTGANASIVLNRTDGAMNYVNATLGFGNFGTVNNFPLRLTVNSLARLTLNSDNSLVMKSGASCTAGGMWANASSIALKENISVLGSDEAAATLQALNPVKYNYKAEKEERHVGFIAEEVPELVAMKDRKSLSPMDIVAVLTKVTQDQQKQLQEQRRINESLARKMLEQEQNNIRMQMEITGLKMNR